MRSTVPQEPKTGHRNRLQLFPSRPRIVYNIGQNFNWISVAKCDDASSGRRKFELRLYSSTDDEASTSSANDEDIPMKTLDETGAVDDENYNSNKKSSFIRRIASAVVSILTGWF